MEWHKGAVCEHYPRIIRLVWMMVWCVSLLGAGAIVLSSWNNFRSNPTIITVDPESWRHPLFPAVSVCLTIPNETELQNGDVANNLRHEQRFDEETDKIIGSFLADIISAKIITSGETILKYVHNHQLNNFKLRDIMLQLHKCENLISDCAWEGVPFDCCSEFKRTFYIFGVCFTFNSYLHHSQRSTEDTLPIELSNHIPVKLRRVNPNKLAEGLEFKLKYLSKICLHQANEPTILNTRKCLVRGGPALGVETLINKAIETTDMLEIRSLSFQQRGCLYPNEGNLLLHKYYGLQSCAWEVAMKEQQRLCNCTSYVYPETDDYVNCDLKGLYCLIMKKDELDHLEVTEEDKENFEKSCPSLCEEVIFSAINPINTHRLKTDIIRVRFAHMQLIHYKRSILYSWTDLMVTFGDTFSLFLGASMLSLVEMLYWFTVRARKE